MEVKWIVVMHLTATEKEQVSVVLGVTEKSVLDEAVLLELDEDVMTLDGAVRVLGEVVLKPCKAVKIMIAVPVIMKDEALKWELVIFGESVIAVLLEAVLEEPCGLVEEGLDEVVM